MANRVTISPSMFTWARERAGLQPFDLTHKFPKLQQWEMGESKPSLKQLEQFARAVHVPFGYLFLQEPPQEPLPIPDFRTIGSKTVSRPSPNLLDMIYACQERQGWYREFSQATLQPEVDFVSSAKLDDSVEVVAAKMASVLKFDIAARAACRTWEEALRLFISQADQAGVLVMVSGVVLSNNNRTLDVKEFRGFALVDRRAPLVFINGADSKAGQMFTLAHELAHLWLGESAVSNAGARPPQTLRREEVWCNAVAAELLVPLSEIRKSLIPGELIDKTVPRLARRFKVSSLVVLRRLLDAKYLSQNAFDSAWDAEITRLQEVAENSGSGGTFYRTTLSRVSRRFARALVESTLEGQTLYRDAFRMLGVAKTETFNNLGREVGALI